MPYFNKGQMQFRQAQMDKILEENGKLYVENLYLKKLNDILVEENKSLSEQIDNKDNEIDTIEKQCVGAYMKGLAGEIV